MVKSAGFLKKLKKVGQLVGKGVGMVNDNIIKPLRPVIDTGLDMFGFGGAKKVLDGASNLIDQFSGYKPSSDDKLKKIIGVGTDFVLDTQRAPSDKKYGGFW